MIYKLIDTKTAMLIMVAGNQVLAYRNTSESGYSYVYTRQYKLYERYENSGTERQCRLLLSKALSLSWFVCNGMTRDERLLVTGEPETIVISGYTGRWDRLRANTGEVSPGQKVFVRDGNHRSEYDGFLLYLAEHNLSMTMLRVSAQEGGAYYSVQAVVG